VVRGCSSIRTKADSDSAAVDLGIGSHSLFVNPSKKVSLMSPERGTTRHHHPVSL
jgi:hypothetical protein